jgi:hypothetical protein
MSSTPLPSYHVEYLLWLGYYLDFFVRFPLPDPKAERVRVRTATTCRASGLFIFPGFLKTLLHPFG